MLFRRAATIPFCLAAAALAGSSCDCGAKPEPLPAGELCGTGTVDGTDYAVDAKGTQLVLAIAKKDAFGCGALHSHVVLATSATFTYDLAADAAGEVKIVVPTASLDPDDKDLRKDFLPEGENQELSEDDRESIRGSVAEEVKASEFSTMTFTLKNLSTLDGDGTATLVSEIAGETGEETEVTYNAKKSGDDVVVSGTAVIDGAPHGIPRNSLGFCVDEKMDLHFKVALTPGTAECEGDVPDNPAFEQQFFDDTECGTVGYNVVYNNVVGPRCMGCHGGTFPGNDELLRGGATVPLVAWRDFRVDSLRNPGEAMYLKAHEYVNLDPDNIDVLAMPPAANGEATRLQGQLLDPTGVPADITTELDLFNAWVIDGLGRDTQCADDVEKKTFGTKVEPAADCTAAIGYDEPNPDFIGPDPLSGEDGPRSARDFFETNCMYCHAEEDPLGAPSAPKVGTTDAAGGHELIAGAGALPVTHPFYVADDGTPLSFWQASIHRTDDGSMAPEFGIGAFEGEVTFEAFKAWVDAGYCE